MRIGSPILEGSLMKGDALRNIQGNEKGKPHAGITFSSGLLIREATCPAVARRAQCAKVKRNWESLRLFRGSLVRNHLHIQIWFNFHPLKVERRPVLSAEKDKRNTA